MIYDCFLYNGEDVMLKIRCEELKELNPIHILVECAYTFSGQKKDFKFKPEDFAEYNIRYVQLTTAPNNGDPWENEKYCRNCMVEGLFDAKDDDIIILADCDEIINKNVFEKFNGQFTALMLDKFGLYLNVLEGAQSWNRAKMFTYGWVRGFTPEQVRNAGYDYTINNAGWHFSYCGGLEAILDKAKAFSHQEEAVQKHFTEENIKHKLETVESLWGTDHWQVVPIDSTFPQYVQDHQHDTLKHLIYEKP